MLNDFEKNVLGATGYKDEKTGTFVSTKAPAPVAEPAPEKSFFKDNMFGRGLANVGNFGIGVAKGAADTIMSVPRNVEKVVKEGTKLSIETQNNKIREQITQQNDELLKLYKALPEGDPRKEKYKKLIQQNLDQFNELGKSEADTIAQVDHDASYVPGDTGGNMQRTTEDALATKNKAQQWGFRGEKIGELIVPGGATAKADKALSSMKILNGTGTGAKIFNAGARILAKSGLEAGTAAVSTLGQGAYQGRLDTEEGRAGLGKEMKQNALFAGGAKALFATGGEVLKETGIPKWFAQRTYKPDVKEVQRELAGALDKGTKKEVLASLDDTARTLKVYDQGIAAGDIAADDIYKAGTDVLTDQAKKNLVEDMAMKLESRIGGSLGRSKANHLRELTAAGDMTYDDIAKTAKDVVLENVHSADDLATWAMSKDLKGSTQNQFNQVARIADRSEDALMKSADAAKTTIKVDPGMKQFAKDFAEEYSTYGRGEVAQKANKFLESVSDDGTVSLRDAISFKRAIDGVRSKASFRNAKVGDNIAYWADDIRHSINSIDNLGSINKEYSLALKAKELLGKKIVSESGKQPVGALEMYTAIPQASGEGFSLAGLGAVLAKRTINSPRLQMGVNTLSKTLQNSSKAGIAARRILPEVVRDSMQSDFGN